MDSGTSAVTASNQVPPQLSRSQSSIVLPCMHNSMSKETAKNEDASHTSNCTCDRVFCAWAFQQCMKALPLLLLLLRPHEPHWVLCSP